MLCTMEVFHLKVRKKERHCLQRQCRLFALEDMG